MKTSKSVERRRHEIVAWVNANGQTQVETLAAHFHTSEVTIRKDLSALAEQGVIIRQFGGAIPAVPSPSSHVMPMGANESSCASPMGRIAAEFVRPGHKLVIDCGTTTTSLLPFLSAINDLVVMTNSLSSANFLTQCNNEPTVLMTGGTWDAQSQSFQGAMAEKLISAYSFDIAFIGAAGIDVARGTTTFNELTGVTRAMANAASKVIVMASAKKLSHKMPNLELGWRDINVLITDQGISEQDKQRIEEQGVAVYVASSSGE
ncbi:DeoR/GlpR family DNA-binding transcription regulator [Alteromonas sp. D210916BOD_24]|uniref:DeoR/GlpR family DNA-binding transcription regulator n=1 Tax=Alteromonas sp. D210916BOD_24 TaxID=3157618 RepID=UPI00399CFBCF